MDFNLVRQDPADQLETASFVVDATDPTRRVVRVVQRNDRRTIVAVQNIGAVSCWLASTQNVSAALGKKLTPGSVFVLDNYIGDIFVAADAAGPTTVDVLGAVRSQA